MKDIHIKVNKQKEKILTTLWQLITLRSSGLSPKKKTRSSQHRQKPTEDVKPRYNKLAHSQSPL